MNTEFTTILKKLVTEQGKEVLFNPAKCKAFLADYTHGEFKKESRLLIQTIEAGVPKAINTSDDLSQCKQQQIRVLQDEFFIAEDIADDIINTLGFILNKTGEQTTLSSQNKSIPSYGTDKQIPSNMIKGEQKEPLLKNKKDKSNTLLRKIVIIIIAIIIVALIFIIGCIVYVNTLNAQTIYTYQIGDTGPAGGIIFYDKGNNSGGWRYLEAAPVETDRIPLTFASFPSLAEINNRTLGAGLNNTRLYLEKLRNNNVTGNTAPWICDTLVHNGYSDWFLPSLDELLMMYTNLRNNRNAGFQSSSYWTSTCFPNSSAHPGAAYFVDFSNGQARIGSWSETFRVRAIRRF